MSERVTNESKCYVDKTVCKKAGTEACTDGCRAFILMEAIYSFSGIPKRYQREKKLTPGTSDLESLNPLNEFNNKILNHVEEGEGVFLFSKGTGNGKTSWVCKIANEYIRKMLFTKEIDDLVYYVNTPELLENLRRGYDDGEYDLITHKLKNAKIVIFDDIGAEKSTEWVRERLYTLINHRVMEGLTTLYTSNLTIDEIRDNLGSRVASRIKEGNLFVELKGQDRRAL